MKRKSRSSILPLFFVIMLISIFFSHSMDIEDLQNSSDGKWQMSAKITRFVYPILNVADSFGVILLAVCISWFYHLDRRLEQGIDAPKFTISARLYYYMLVFNFVVSLTCIFVSVFSLLTSNIYAFTKLIFGSPLIHLCWFGMVVTMLVRDRKYLKGIIKIDNKYS